ncbi:MAG: hypothetical protein N3F07_01170 [Candidatus Micrarchaeota archaeon]|nr:hypothetical protein [Candidatus Micrarchaeota archaeon]
MGFRKKGQGATEYLVLLAVVLIIALVSIALLGFFPGLASDARITQSNSYWRGEARPIAILEHSFTPTSGRMVIQNYEAMGSLSGVVVNVGTCLQAISPSSIGPGETRTVNFSSNCGQPTTPGSVYDLNVSFNYTTPNGISTRQFGAKNIVGKVS